MAFSGFAFLDTETTGIKPQEEAVLEIGVLLVDLDFNEIDSKYWITKTPGSASTFNEFAQSTSKDREFVQKMHIKSGLWEEFEKASVMAPSYYSSSIIQWLADHEAAGLPMCGNTISFDRNFLREHFPEIDDMFHYRSIDVSSIREFFRTKHPEVADNVLKCVEEVMGIKDTQHRTVSDCRWSMETLRAYNEKFEGGVK